MIYYGTEDDKQYLYTVMCTKHGGQRPYQVMRSRISCEEGPGDKWEPVTEAACGATWEAELEALRRYAKEKGLWNGECGRCWHLREGDGRPGCHFFWKPLERVRLEYFMLPIRCEDCLEWGEYPPG